MDTRTASGIPDLPPWDAESIWSRSTAIIVTILWTIPMFFAAKLYFLALVPLRAGAVAFMAVTWPVRYLFGTVLTWLLEEFEAVIIFLVVAAVLGIAGGMFLRLVSLGVATVLPSSGPDRGYAKIKSSDSGPRYSDDSDYAFNEAGPSTYKSAPSPGGSKMLPGRSLVGQTIHEEDVSS